MNLVFFDFDDTVTMLDTTFPSGAFFAAQLPSRSRLILLGFVLGMAKARLLSNDALKRAFAKLFFRGQKVECVRLQARQFHDRLLETLSDEAVLGALRMHVDRGDSVYLVSANFDCLLEPLVDRWSLAGIVATEAEHLEGVYTGGLVGAACHGEEKLRRVVARFGRTAIEGAVAYGNRDDAPLLRVARTSFLVRRDQPVHLSERLRQWSRILSGQLTRHDLSAARRIERFVAPGTPESVAPADA